MSGLGHGQSSWLYSSKASAAGPNSFLRCVYTHSGRIQKNQGPNWDSGSYFPWLPPGSIPPDPVPAWTPSSFRSTPCLHDFQQHPLASGSLCTSVVSCVLPQIVLSSLSRTLTTFRRHPHKHPASVPPVGGLSSLSQELCATLHKTLSLCLLDDL